MNIEVESFNGNLLMEPWELKTKTGGPYKVFSPFWKNLISHPRPLAPIAAPASSHKCNSAPNDSRTLSCGQSYRGQMVSASIGLPDTTQPKSSRRLRCIHCARLQRAKESPGKPGTSRLSPRLRFGEISPRQVWQSIESHHPNALEGEGTEAYLREIGWREFAYHLIYHFPETIEAPLRPQFERFPWRDAPEELKRWQKGTTGFPIVDAGMRELWHTGWMHNRVRMIVASFLVKNLSSPGKKARPGFSTHW